MITVFVYLCFILGLISLIKAPFRLYRFIKSEKKGGFLNVKFRNHNGRRRGTDGRTGGGTDNRANSDRVSYKPDDDGENGNDYDRMPVIDIGESQCRPVE